MKRLASVGAVKLTCYLRENVEARKLNKYEEYLVPDASPSLGAELEEETIAAIIDEDERLGKFLAKLENNPVALTMAELLILRLYLPETAILLDMVACNNDNGVSFETALLVSGVEEEDPGYYEYLKEAYDRLELIFMAGHATSEIKKEVLHLDERTARYFSEQDEMDEAINRDASLFDAEENTVKLFGYEEKVKSFAQGIRKLQEESQKESFIINIQGEKNSGRSTIAKKIGQYLNTKLILVDFSYLLNSKEGMKRARKVIRECLLQDAILVVKNVNKQEDCGNLVGLEKLYREYTGRIIMFTSLNEVKLVPEFDENVISFCIPKMDADTSIKIWKGYLAEIRDKEKLDINVAELSSLLCLNAGQIKKTVETLKMKLIMTEESVSNKDIFKICYEILDDGRYDNVHRVTPGFCLEDIYLSEKNKNTLIDIKNQVLNRHKVYDEWGMKKKYAYGRCVSILLAGPPGTGKTMAVHALANELGLDLYKVDLSQVVDKYIGETEKRLEEVFKKAEKSNMILFFDEADAMMGKRTDTNDARDKSANTQIAFILQRIEEFDGIVVLATNLLKNIDTAFMRRIRYVLQFDYPEKEERLGIWKSAFGEKVPVSPTVDFEYLAETFNFTGAIIKNVVLNATFYAAAQNTSVSIEHIIKAIMKESIKDRSIIQDADLGRYEYLLR